jgi:uncharacterized protein involved in exopolysaccharide biosynthesis
MTQVVTAQAATAQAKARYERIKNIIDTHQTKSAVTESLAKPVKRASHQISGRLKPDERFRAKRRRCGEQSSGPTTPTRAIGRKL